MTWPYGQAALWHSLSTLTTRISPTPLPTHRVPSTSSSAVTLLTDPRLIRSLGCAAHGLCSCASSCSCCRWDLRFLERIIDGPRLKVLASPPNSFIEANVLEVLFGAAESLLLAFRAAARASMGSTSSKPGSGLADCCSKSLPCAPTLRPHSLATPLSAIEPTAASDEGFLPGIPTGGVDGTPWLSLFPSSSKHGTAFRDASRSADASAPSAPPSLRVAFSSLVSPAGCSTGWQITSLPAALTSQSKMCVSWRVCTFHWRSCVECRSALQTFWPSVTMMRTCVRSERNTHISQTTSNVLQSTTTILFAQPTHNSLPPSTRTRLVAGFPFWLRLISLVSDHSHDSGTSASSSGATRVTSACHRHLPFFARREMTTRVPFASDAKTLLTACVSWETNEPSSFNVFSRPVPKTLKTSWRGRFYGDPVAWQVCYSCHVT